MNNKDHIKFGQYKKSLTCQPFFIWHRLEDLTDEKLEFDSNSFWSEETIEEISDNPAQVLARTFDVFNNHLVSALIRDNETEVLSSSMSVEAKIEATKELMNSGKVIINPTFEYKTALATPLAFDTKTGTIINIKYSKKTKRDDFIKAYYDFSIISKNTEVKEYNLFLPTNKIYEKGEIDLECLNAMNPRKSGMLPHEQTAKGLEKDENIMGILESRVLDKKTFFPDFDHSLQVIERSKEIAKPSQDYDLDSTAFGLNRSWDDLLAYFEHKFAGFNGNVVPKKSIITEDYKESEILDVYLKLDGPVIYDTDSLSLIETIRNSKTVLWYDYEGFSLPFSPMDGVPPYGQVVFQVSAIKTVDNVETEMINLVVDPKTISLDDFFDILKVVYAGGADAYIVYNNGYEDTRNREMVGLMRAGKHKDAEEAARMHAWINEHTIDLYDIFKIGGRNARPGILMHDQKLKSSIKNIEKHITSNEIDLPRPITPYKNLDVQNGGMAMDLAINRALGILGDNVWSEKVAMLKKYCENDVRAMIMVYDFIIKLIEEKR